MNNWQRKSVFEILGRGAIHPFPARMAPGIALNVLGKTGGQLRVLDPMAGSGTVLAVARAMGHRSFGIDRDPLAVLIARVWTRPVRAERILEKAPEVLDRAKALFVSAPSGEAYPFRCDEETRKFVRYWFDDYSRRQLSALSDTIRLVRDPGIRDVLWSAFSRLIITKSAGASLALDLSHSRPHRVFAHAPVKPFNAFLAAVAKVVSNCPQYGNGVVGPSTVVKSGDARRLPFHDLSMDLVLTSPPYLNAIDYMRCSKFSLIWMGYNLSDLRSINRDIVGSGSAYGQKVDLNRATATLSRLIGRRDVRNIELLRLATYVMDMDRSIAEVARVLKSRARAVYVIGDSFLRSTFIKNSAILAELAMNHGLMLSSKHSRELPANRRYLPPPGRSANRSKLDSRMRREVILEFEKSW